MKNEQNIFMDKKPRPQSSTSIHNLPKISMKYKNKKSYPIISNSERESDFDFNINLNPKIDAERMYKDNLDLKEIIKELKKKIDFYKTNNQKLIQTISKKNKEINELTNQVILKNKELMTKEKRQKENKDKDKNKNKINKNSNENNFDDQLKIKKLKNEVNSVKEEMQRLQLTILKKDEELFNIKKNKKYTDYQELIIKYEILKDEFNKLRGMKLINSDKNYIICKEEEKNLKIEIQQLKELILALNKEKDRFYLEKKKLNDEINDLKNKLELANNNSKLMKNKKRLYEEKYRKSIKEQVIQKEYEEEKKEMTDKINTLQKKLDYYMLNAVKNKEYIINKNNKTDKEDNKNNNYINNEIRRNIINVKNISSPEENCDNKILLMQSLITELTKENKELLEKNKSYEMRINSLLQTNKEILNSNMGLDNLFISNSIKNNDDIQKEKNVKQKKDQDEMESISKDEDD